MAEILITLPTLHEGQVKAFEVKSQNRYFALRCGRRFGKSEFLAALLADTAINGELAGLFAPDYKRLSETYLRIYDILRPIVRSSWQNRMIRTINGGSVEFWTLGDESAGRSRKYHRVGIDEAAFAKPVGSVTVMDIWKRAIKPTLLDYRGEAVVASNTSGEDPENFFWQITNQPEHGFVEYHAPSAENPYLPADEIEALRKSEDPLVFAQEYEAKWVNWAGVAFFSLDKLLVDGKPPPMPKRVDAVFAIIDTAVKTGTENDGSGVVYYGLNQIGDGHPLTILDWDIQQIAGDLLIEWLPSVFMRLNDLAKECRAMSGSIGVWIEDKQSGSILIQAAQRLEMNAYAIDTALTAKGKDERALAASGYVYRGDVKICEPAFEKTTTYKKMNANHLIKQVCGFRLNDKDAGKRADDLLDCFTYGITISLGNSKGF